MAVQPFSGKITITQFYHDSTVKGKIYDQNALDLSPRGLKDWKIRAPKEGTIVKAVPNSDKGKVDGYFEIQTTDECYHCFVHCLINPKIKVGFRSKENGYIGDIDPTPVNATGAHAHYFILDKKRKPVDILAYFIKLGIYPNDWLLDPNKLIKGKYQMSKPKPTSPVIPPQTTPVDPCEEKIRGMVLEYSQKISTLETTTEALRGELSQSNDLLVKKTKELEEANQYLVTLEPLKKTVSELESHNSSLESEIRTLSETILRNQEEIRNLETVNLSLRKKRNINDIGSIFTSRQIQEYIKREKIKEWQGVFSKLLELIKDFISRMGK